jgi:hypothetical protein
MVVLEENGFIPAFLNKKYISKLPQELDFSLDDDAVRKSLRIRSVHSKLNSIRLEEVIIKKLVALLGFRKEG